MPLTILSGPTGTELTRRGVKLPARVWSADAVESAPDILSDIHAEYAAAGATRHIACTFRTQPAHYPDDFARLTAAAVRICRESVPSHHRVAGSLAPIGDCYTPNPGLDAGRARARHAAMARALADAGVDLIICETFPDPVEAMIALRESLRVGLETWVSLTPGPTGALLTPVQVGAAAGEAFSLGAAATLVNCSPPERTLDYVRALKAALNATTRRGLAIGAYANAGLLDEPIGPVSYADLAATWAAAGATLIGSCCGTIPAHTAELAQRLG